MGGNVQTNTLSIAPAAPTTLHLGGNLLTLNSGGLLVTGSNAVTIGDNAGDTLTAGSATIGSTDELIIQQYSTAPLTINASIITNPLSTSTALTKAGPGTTILNGTNTYAGKTTVAGGTLVSPNPATLGSYNVSGNVAVSAGATLQINYGGPSDWTQAQVAGPGLLNAGNLANFAPGATLAFDTTNAGASGGTYTTAISGNINLSKIGPNALYLGTTAVSTNNSYTGNTTLNAGALEISERQPSSHTVWYRRNLYLNGGTLSALPTSATNDPFAANPYFIGGSIGLGDTAYGGNGRRGVGRQRWITVPNPTIYVGNVGTGIRPIGNWAAPTAPI